MDNKKKSNSPSFAKRFSQLSSKALKSKSVWEDKDEFLDVVYWMRQFMGIIFGLIWGVLGFKGMFAIISYCLVNALFVYVYSVSFQQIDEDEYGGVSDIIKEGFMTSFSSFLVFWIVVYSALHA
ncbi:unnamed protein product [Brachionus calyciflorus]|uniref:Rab5-interacting protein n=1 Tax=Brachionus calyciflorus TaxID=104777 RepID=A0A813VXY6_9BILA|nr:unnamed protein product [Brachionus calyciflorus]